MGSIYDDEEFFDRYAQMSRSRQGLSGAGEWRQFERLFPDLMGKAVLDLGCGYGWHCKYAVERGAAHALGLDASPRMIRAAREKNADPKIAYATMRLEDYDYPAEAYDCAISNLALHYVADLAAIYQKVFQTLRPGGAFLINIEHPSFTAGVNQDWIYDADGAQLYWPIDRYFYPGERETRFLGQRVVKQHHTLTQILMGLLNAGFRLDAVEEAMPGPEQLSLPHMEDEMRRPMMLLIRAAKPRRD